MAIQNFSPLQLNGTLSVGVDDTGHDVKFYGATASHYMLWDESADLLQVAGDLEIKNANGSNPHRIKSKTILFTVKDDEKNAQDKIAQVADVMDAVQSALKMPLNELVGYAKVLGVNTNKSVDEIRWDMKIQAEKNPTAFLAGMNDPRTEMKQLLLMAQESGIISMKKTAVTWVSSGNTICVPAIGVKPIERMVDFCSEGEGEQIYSEIERRLKAINS